MYDVFNHINWSNPNADVGYSGGVLANSSAGTITNAINSGNGRIIQLGAHLRF